MIVLDTHAWLWLVSEPTELGRRARNAIQRERSLGVAAISCWEVAMLAARHRITLDRDPISWMDAALAPAGVELLPLTPALAVASASLASFHGDPADRLIVATALIYGAALVTKDEQIREAKLVRTIW